MDKATISKIISAVVGLALIGFGGYLVNEGVDTHGDLLIYAGLAVIGGGLGTTLLPSTLGKKTPPPLPVLFLVALASVGCDRSDLRTHAALVIATSGGHEVAGAAIDQARSDALDRVEVEHPTNGPERTAALREEDARWRPAGVALDGIRTILGSWSQSLEVALLADTGEDVSTAMLPFAARIVVLWDDLSRFAEELGVTIPRLPEGVRSLALLFAGLGGGP